MNTQHSPFGAPRKELINSLQRGVFALLFILLLAFSGMYMLTTINVERQHVQQEKLSGLLELVHSAEKYWLQWLLVGDQQIYSQNSVLTPSSSYLHQMLVGEYRFIKNHLDGFGVKPNVYVSDSLVLLSALSQKELDSVPLTEKERGAVYSSLEGLEALDDVLLQIGVGLDYEHQFFVERLIWVPVAFFLLITVIVMMLTVRFGRQLRSGFSSLHYILDRHKHGHVSILAPRNVVDEFTDLNHLVDSELASRNFDLDQQGENLSLIEK
ncbi:MAG: hypothetical protein ACI85E_001776, partial [Marinomonas primoryensis]